MEVIKLNHPYNKEDIPQNDIILVLGFFDGVHRGHQEVINQGINEAKKRGLKTAVMTFNRHPGFIFSNYHPRDVHYLTNIKQKENHMADMGVDYLYELNFTSSLGNLSPEAFITQYIIGLNAKVVVAGFDYTFGKPKVANMKLMNELSGDRFDVITVDEQTGSPDEKISSTVIRQAIKDGELEKANNYLGYPYEMEGFIIHGKERGRKLGFPTANIYPDPTLIVPKIGVYATKTYVQGKWYDSMTSIGYNVTFGKSDEYTIESNLFGFNGEIYGEDVKIEWHKRIRGEVKFEDVDGLIDQLKADEVEIKEYFAKEK